MNLAKLFDMQRELGKVGLFAYKGEDRFNKLVLALLVELGECANEWRGFKFWSKDQEPRRWVSEGICHHCVGTGNKLYDQENGELEFKWEDCPRCEGEGENSKFPLLEEYVDGLHFVLELGIELEYKNPLYIPIGIYPKELSDYFIELYNKISELNILQAFHKGEKVVKDSYQDVFDTYLHLGHRLGFTWEEIEQAYMAKNAVNHQRQEQGY